MCWSMRPMLEIGIEIADCPFIEGQGFGFPLVEMFRFCA